MAKFFDNPLLLIILLLIIVLVFGAKRLPDAARSVGRSMRIFKSEVKEMRDDDAPGKGQAGGPSQPLEGRVVPGDEHDRSSHDPRGRERRDV
jgi:sec-independent protein translocase protein TatA